jgi:hypothetical protein
MPVAAPVRDPKKDTEAMQQAWLDLNKTEPVKFDITRRQQPGFKTLDEVTHSTDPAAAFKFYLMDKGFKFNDTANPADMAPGSAVVPNTLHALELVADPILRGVQDEFGRPLVEKALDYWGKSQDLLDTAAAKLGDTRPKQSKEDRAAAEMLMRSASTLIAGPAVLERAPDATKAAAMRNKFMAGPGGAAAMSVGQQVGELPLWLVGTGKYVKIGEEALAAAKANKGLRLGGELIGKTALHTVGGAEMGLKFGLMLPSRPESEIQPGMSAEEGAKGGALLGGGMQVAAAGKAAASTMLGKMYEGFKSAIKPKRGIELMSAAVPESARKPTTVALFTPQGLEDAHQELLVAHRVNPTEAPPPETVNFIRFFSGPDGNARIGIFGGTTATGPQVAELPVTPETTALAFKMARKHGVIVDGAELHLPWEDPSFVAWRRAQVTPEALAARTKMQELLDSTNETMQVNLKFRPGFDKPYATDQGNNNDTKAPPVDLAPNKTEPKLAPPIDDGPFDYTPVSFKGVLHPDGQIKITPVYPVGNKRLPDEIPVGLRYIRVGDKIFSDWRFNAPLKGEAAAPAEVVKFAPKATDSESTTGLYNQAQDFRDTANLGPVKGPTGDTTTMLTAMKEGATSTGQMDVLDAAKLGLNPGAFGLGAGSYKGGASPKIGFGQKKTPTPMIANGLGTFEPPEMPQPSRETMPPEVLADLDSALRLSRGAAQQKLTLKDKALDFFLARHLRGPADLATWIQSYQSGQTLQRSSEDMYKAFRQKFGGQLLDKTDRQMYDYFKGTKIWQDVERPPGMTDKMWEDARLFSHTVLVEKNRLDQRLAELGYVPSDTAAMRSQHLMDLYLARRYLAYAMPAGRWAKVVSGPAMQETFDKGVEHVFTKVREVNPEVTRDEVAHQVLDIIRDPQVGLDTSPRGTTGQVFSSLMKKKDVHPDIRKLMGEMESGQIAASISLGSQRALVARLELMHELMKTPHISEKPDFATGRTYQLPDNKQLGPAANKFVNRDVFGAVTMLNNVDAASHSWVTKTLGFLKGNQVALGGVGPILNSTMGNLWSGTLSGGLDMTRPLKSARHMKTAYVSLRDYAKDPTGKTGMGWLVTEAKRVGADFFGFGHEEIGNPAAHRFLRDLEGIFPKDKPVGFFDAWGKINGKLFDRYRNLQMKGGELLDYNDRFFRMQSYAALRDKFLADLGANGDRAEVVRVGLLKPEQASVVDARQLRALAQGFITMENASPTQQAILESVARLSARRINQSFWNPTFIGPGLDKLRRSAVGFVAPYATAAFETGRIHLMLPNRLRVEPDLKWRMLANGMVVGAALGGNGLMQHLNGISDEDIQAADATRSKGSKFYRPVQIAMGWRDSRGRIQYWDATRMWDPLRYLQGVNLTPAPGAGVGVMPDDPALPLIAKALSNVAISPIEGGFLEPIARTGLATTGATPYPPVAGRPNPVTDTGAMAVISYLFKESLFPGIANNAYAAAQQTDLIPGRQPYQEQLTPVQGAMKAIGLGNIQPVTRGYGPSDVSAQMEFSRRQKDIKAGWDKGPFPTSDKIRAKLQAAQDALNKDRTIRDARIRRK